MSLGLTQHTCLILDACCAINLFKSDQLAELLTAMGVPIAIAAYVNEVELLDADLQPFIDSG